MEARVKQEYRWLGKGTHENNLSTAALSQPADDDGVEIRLLRLPRVYNMWQGT